MAAAPGSPELELPDRRRVGALRRRLFAWYREHHRDLPWRRTRDPYAIWISEAMLQQTRVETVIPYYHRFLEAFPDIAALAAADEEDVVARWSGLGYYRRARSLHAAAARMVQDHGGQFPRSKEDVLGLPGIGPYTAGAVLSIAFGQAEPLVDGNVLRVFARLFLLEDRVGSSRLDADAWVLARHLMPPETAALDELDPGVWNQALMELGARVCTPRSASCGECPVAAFCGARAAGRVDELPLPKKKRETLDVILEVLVPAEGDRLLFVRRPDGGRMSRMWELPTREVPGATGTTHGLWPPDPGLELEPGTACFEVSHGITHHRIRARVLRADLVGDGAERESRWATPAEADELGLTGLTKKILARLRAPSGIDGLFP